jgi:1,4-alpha-glucan branching enzyme
MQGVYELLHDASDLYVKNEALHSKDMTSEGFEWINNISARENILVFIRKGSKKDDGLVVVVNLENVPRKQYKIGVPKAGKYTEVFNSDDEKYDGFGFINKTPVMSSKDECDKRNDSIKIKVAPLSVTVFRYNPAKES